MAAPLVQEIGAGEEVCISYGCQRKSNDELMRDYGMVFRANANDRIPFVSGEPNGGWGVECKGISCQQSRHACCPLFAAHCAPSVIMA